MFLRVFLLFSIGFNLAACASNSATARQKTPDDPPAVPASSPESAAEIRSPEIEKTLESAREQLAVTKTYDPAYVAIPYPMGDVPAETGVCTDVVIRAFRRAGVDLQKEVHEDMRANFPVYPKKWGLPAPDTNIDHRRVSNLQTFFERKGKALPIDVRRENYRPGDVVSWDLNGRGLTHIGLVSDIRDEKTGRFLIIHNIGAGARAEDVLFEWKITGHFRYF